MFIYPFQRPNHNGLMKGVKEKSFNILVVLKSDCNDIRVVSWRGKSFSYVKAKNYAIHNSRHELLEGGG